MTASFFEKRVLLTCRALTLIYGYVMVMHSLNHRISLFFRPVDGFLF